ncbi:histone-lysine N-methyltransferase, H3 lysine-9 specific SUVH4 isoform X2 [Lactuca sativa]|uniref:histone-lysine N-methyltransferase, H3 lysine-9 specific SUVH4 isoform X2 n=1 Tax=Lactuca sativa TaxID=4236 RepID=UPI0022AF83B6|nr:histone-lysine N-methyltransferase, H3 lysine-9 specific SUVH4 isoform X2 [Lactuca sativa]
MGSDKSLCNGTLDVSVTKKFGQRVQKMVSEECPVKKRCSPRLRKIPEGKKPFYGPPRKASQHHPIDFITSDAAKLESLLELHEKDAVSVAERKIKCPPTSCKPNLVKSMVTTLDASASASASCITSKEHSPKGGLETSDSATDKKSLDCSYVAHTRNDKARVKKALRIYNKYYLHFFQEQGVCEYDGKRLAKHLDLKKEGICVQSIKRPDLKAISKMLEFNEVLYPTKRFGHLPGIDIGYQFYSRAEMVALGLHSHWVNDIDYMGESYSKMEEFKGYTFPLAVAVVLSAQCEDDLDNLEDIVYIGQGGNDVMVNKHQKMACGDLALKNSIEHCVPVRVVGGHRHTSTSEHQSLSLSLRLYTYYGLYKVSECWPAEGVSASGMLVYKYRLKRLQGQPKLTTNQVQCSNGRSSRVPIKAPELVCLDITEGQEDVCIPVINTIDDTIITGFTYTKYNQVLSNLSLPTNAQGCECKGNCTDPRTCACAKLNGFDFPYVRSSGGRLIEAKDVVFECGPNCGCGPGCINRISQRGIKYQLEVFRTSNRGWAVRSKDFIPCGAPVCEYIGELRRTNELDNVAENDYIFEIDCCQTIKGIGGRERRLGDVSESVSSQLDEKSMNEGEAEFCIDAGRVGNVARFINHSCDPNLFVQCVLSEHHHLRLARILLFASDNIPPMQELTYDYGYALDSVVDNNGTVRTLPCHCGTSDCRNRLY